MAALAAYGRISKLLETVADAALRRPRAVQARHEPRSGPVRPLDAGGVVAARQPLPPSGCAQSLWDFFAENGQSPGAAEQPLEISDLELNSFSFCGPTGCNSLAQPNGLGIRANQSGDLKGRDRRVCSWPLTIIAPPLGRIVDAQRFVPVNASKTLAVSPASSEATDTRRPGKTRL